MTFIQAYHSSTGSNAPVTRIVIHGTVSPCENGGAQANARYFQQSTSGGSAHYIVDPGEVVQCASEDTICWHAPPNQGSIGVELTDPVSGPAARWDDANHDAMLRRAATLVRDIATRHGVPLVRLSPADLLAGKHGICGHVDVSQAWHQSDHTDPGADFPWAKFMGYLTGPATPATKPAPAAKPAAAKPVSNPPFPGVLRQGSTGPAVRTLQARLEQRGWRITADGAFGPGTAQTVRAFQQDKHLTVDGVVGPATWAALWSAPITK